ncbi:hypothetical protein G4F14_003910 [Salmonella enterica]|nr:hypothetical protein [Salmonella enterica]
MVVFAFRRDDAPYIVSGFSLSPSHVPHHKTPLCLFRVRGKLPETCYTPEIGSPGNRRPVIRFRFYKPGCNCIWLKL